jgi:hypothetical protein
MTSRLELLAWAGILAIVVLGGAFLLYRELATVRLSETHSGAPDPGIVGNDPSPVPTWTYTP